jgi:hypothetical protein
MGTIIQATTQLSRRDQLGRFLARASNRFRMGYRISPGLYRLGKAAKQSPVLVTANYKLSFDHLRKELGDLDAWILVLDTRGINVWCAAGKGTFGTDELVERLRATELKMWVAHRRLILPQLAAPGVDAALVRERTGFTVSYGPVRAADLPRYTEEGFRAEAAMRTVRFRLVDRLVLTPMELWPAARRILPWLAGVLAFLGLGPSGILFGPALTQGLPLVLAAGAGLLGGAFLVPALLPWIPFRSFAIKGLTIGALMSGALLSLAPGLLGSPLLLAPALLVTAGLSSYLGLMFTGSTTFTNPSGVNRELRVAVPLYLAAAALAVILLVAHKIATWGSL